MEPYEVIKEADKIAKIVIKKKARKVLGIYYAIWSFYTLIISLFYTIVYSFQINLGSEIAYALINFALVVPFIAYTVKLFSNIHLDYARLVMGKDIKGRKRYLIAIVLFLSLVFVAFILIPFLTASSIYSLASSYAYVSVVLYFAYRFLYSRKRLVDPRYYDLIALISFTLIPLGSISSSTYFIYYIFLIFWLYASIRSLLEVSEVE